MPDPTTGGTPNEHVELHKDGSVRARGQTLDEEFHGYWEWFRLDGSRLRSGYFDGGRQVGEWTTYDRSGAVYKVTTPGGDGVGPKGARRIGDQQE